MPLGSALVDSFTRAVAEEDIREAVEYNYALRFLQTTETEEAGMLLSCVQDRSFNAIEETSAFLGSDGGFVTRGNYEVTDQYPHGRLLLEVAEPPGGEQDGSRRSPGSGGGDDGGPSSTIELTFEWVQWDVTPSGAFVTSELVRQRTTAPASMYDLAQDETSYLEIITRFAPEAPRASSARRRTATVPSGEGGQPTPSVLAAPQTVRVRNRLVQYLTLPGVDDASGGDDAGREAAMSMGSRSRRNQEARKALAAGRAISFFDYDWVMRKDHVGGSLPDQSFGTPKAA